MYLKISVASSLVGCDIISWAGIVSVMEHFTKSYHYITVVLLINCTYNTQHRCFECDQHISNSDARWRWPGFVPG